MDKVKFKEVFRFLKKSNLKASDHDENGKFPFFTSSNILSKKTNNPLFDEVALVIGNGGSANIHFADIPFSTTSHCYIAVTKSKIINAKFVYYYLSTNLHLLERGFKGVGLKNISSKFIEEIEIPLPDLETQNKIVAILDKAKAILDKREETIAKYDELLRATFLEMFGDPVLNEKGWEQVKLIDISTKITDGTHKTPNYLNEGVKFISAKNIKKNSISWSDIKYISEAESNSINSRCNPKFEDILLTKSGSLGQPALVDVDFNFTLFESLALIKYKRDKVTPSFLITYLMSDGVAYFYKQRHKGVAVKHLHLVDIKSIPVYLPPIELQKEFGSKYNKITTLKNKLDNSSESLKLLQKALSQLAFQGELGFNTAVDLEVLLENDYLFFKANSTIKSLQLLIERLGKDELNKNKFAEQEVYDIAKGFICELLKEGTVKQIFDEKTKGVKLIV